MHLPYESLHNHTTLSDGTQSHLELLATAEAHQFGVLAFTDHDALPNQKTLRQLADYAGPVRWHLGCELSAGWPTELGGGAASMFHIVGLFVDPHNGPLLEHCRLAAEARTTRMEKMVANLRKLGFTISADDCLRESGGETVGRPHIVRALQQHASYDTVVDKLYSQLKAASQTDPKAQVMLADLQKSPPSQWPYQLFLSDDSFIPEVYVGYLYWADMDKAVQLIHDAGGVAVLAHWWTIKKKLSLAQVGQFITSKRLDGIEVASNFTGPQAAEDEAAMQSLADSLKCLQTIGIDTHNAAHFGEFLQHKPQAAQASIGQTQRLLAAMEQR